MPTVLSPRRLSLGRSGEAQASLGYARRPCLTNEVNK